MRHLTFTAAAERDLDRIGEYLQRLRKAPAVRIANRLMTAMDRLIAFPGIGRRDAYQSQIAGTDVFRLVRERYIIYYAVDESFIRVLGLIHSKQDVDILMSRRSS